MTAKRDALSKLESGLMSPFKPESDVPMVARQNAN
jgi:hypothetical protein